MQLGLMIGFFLGALSVPILMFVIKEIYKKRQSAVSSA